MYNYQSNEFMLPLIARCDRLLPLSVRCDVMPSPNDYIVFSTSYMETIVHEYLQLDCILILFCTNLLCHVYTLHIILHSSESDFSKIPGTQ